MSIVITVDLSVWKAVPGKASNWYYSAAVNLSRQENAIYVEAADELLRG